MESHPHDDAEKQLVNEIESNVEAKLEKKLQPRIDEQIEKAFAKRNTTFAVPKSHENKSFGEWCSLIAKLAPQLSTSPDEKCKAHNMLTDRYDLNAAETKSNMVQGTSSAGGYTVPVEYSRDLILLEYPDSVFFPTGAFIYPMASSSEKIPSFDYSQAGSSSQSGFGAGLTTGVVSEANTPNNTQPVFSQLTLTAEKYMSLSMISQELLDNNIVGVQEVLTEKLREEMISQIDYACFNGDSAQFSGIDGATAEVLVPRHTTSQIELIDLAKMYGHVLPKRLSNYVWLVHPSAVSQLLTLADAAGRIVFWQGLNVNGEPQWQIFGRPVIITDIVSTLGTTGDICLIDPKLYAVGINKNIQMAVSYDFQFGYDLATFRTTVRCCGAPRLLAQVTARDGSTKLSGYILLKNATS